MNKTGESAQAWAELTAKVARLTAEDERMRRGFDQYTGSFDPMKMLAAIRIAEAESERRTTQWEWAMGELAEMRKCPSCGHEATIHCDRCNENFYRPGQLDPTPTESEAKG